VRHGQVLLPASRENGPGGVIANRLASAYEMGRRSGWLKVKNRLRQELVIGRLGPCFDLAVELERDGAEVILLVRAHPRPTAPLLPPVAGAAAPGGEQLELWAN
jgi:hypothetical protein